MVLHIIAWYYMVLYCIVLSCMVLYSKDYYLVLLGLALYCMELYKQGDRQRCFEQALVSEHRQLIPNLVWHVAVLQYTNTYTSTNTDINKDI